MYRFVLRPLWILSHLFVFALVVTMVLLCAWQIRRLHEREATNAQIRSNTSAPAGGFEVLEGDPGANRWRVVRIRGSYDPASEVAIRNHSNGTVPGRWIVTPLRLEGTDRAVAVLRGFVPAGMDDTEAPFEAVPPPSGVVDVVGYAQPTEERGSIGPRDPQSGTLSELARVDVARLGAQLSYPLEPMWLQATEPQVSIAGAALEPVPLPDLDDGPHLSYAVQWAIFSTIAIVGYPLILRRVAHQKRIESRGDGPPEPTSDPVSAAVVGPDAPDG